VRTDARNRCDRKDILWAFVFGSRIARNCALSQLFLCIHNTDHSHDNYFSISVQFFSSNGPSIFFHHDSPSNLAESRYPRCNTSENSSTLQCWRVVRSCHRQARCRVPAYSLARGAHSRTDLRRRSPRPCARLPAQGLALWSRGTWIGLPSW